MDQRSNSRLSLFLMELIIAIMFFSLSAAVCVRLFTTAHLIAERTENLSSAVMWSQNLTESFMAMGGDLDEISQLYPDAYVTEDTLILFFNRDWEMVDEALSQASYEALLKVKRDTAENVYSDVKDYNVPLVGDALVGDITVLDIRGDQIKLGIEVVEKRCPPDQAGIGNLLHGDRLNPSFCKEFKPFLHDSYSREFLLFFSDHLNTYPPCLILFDRSILAFLSIIIL